MSADPRTRYMSLHVKMASVIGAEVERWPEADILGAYVALKTSSFEEWQAVLSAMAATGSDPVPEKLTPEVEAANAAALSDLGLKTTTTKVEAA